MKTTKAILAILLLASCMPVKGQTITTVAGNGTFSLDTNSCPADGGQATASIVNILNVLRADASGNIYYTTYGPYWDCIHLKKINAAGIVSTVAGNGIWMTHSGDGGPATAAGFYGLDNFCIDHTGNIYIMEQAGDKAWIRKVNTSGIVSTVAGGDSIYYSGDGGPASAAGFDGFDIAMDAVGNIYFTDKRNSRIRKISTAGIISTVAGTGVYGYSGDGGAATNAELDLPEYIALDGAGNIYFTDQPPSAVIRKITPSGIISTISNAATMHLDNIHSLTCDNSGNLYFSDVTHEVVRKLDKYGTLTIAAGNEARGGFSGDGGKATAATLSSPQGVAIDAAGNLLIGDVTNYRIRKVSFNSTGLENTSFEEGTLNISPNPSNGAFNVMIPSTNNEATSVVITNTLGQVIKESIVNTNSESQIKLEVAPGIYFIHATAEQQQFYSKILIK